MAEPGGEEEVAGRPVPAEEGLYFSSDTPLEANLKLGQSLNVTGTPAIIFPDGSRAPGLIDAATLERKFAALKKS